MPLNTYEHQLRELYVGMFRLFAPISCLNMSFLTGIKIIVAVISQKSVLWIMISYSQDVHGS